MSFRQSLSAKWFRMVHGSNLVYNTCWEDPRLDRQALKLGPDDTVLVITSAGCNALDYLLESPRHVYAVDMNPRQNALLELKQAAIQGLEYEDFFEMFGRGRLTNCRKVYAKQLRGSLSPAAAAYWDRRIDFFQGRGWRSSFYFRGTSGTFARCVNWYIDRVAKIRDSIESILLAGSVDEQRRIYDDELHEVFWSRFMRWAVGRDTTLSFLGVPQAQRKQVELDYTGGISRFIEDCIESVFARLPLSDNYFWRVYLTGSYTPECCPEYLKADNFARLKDGLTGRLTVHTDSVTDFLRGHTGRISRFVLLDHQDWLSQAGNQWLQEEWQQIVNHASPDARVLWRSGGLRTDFVDAVPVALSGRTCQVGELLRYDRPLADSLHTQDRVHTYGSFHIADLAFAG